MSFQDPARVMGHSTRCTPQSAPIVAMLPSYPLGRVVTGPCTAAIAIAKQTEQVSQIKYQGVSRAELLTRKCLWKVLFCH
jgi:hypothetical protein